MTKKQKQALQERANKWAEIGRTKASLNKPDCATWYPPKKDK